MVAVGVGVSVGDGVHTVTCSQVCASRLSRSV